MMDNAQYSKLFSFIWNIANDVLVFAFEKFDFCVMNPPFGTPWKEDLKNCGISDKKEVIDPRFFHGETKGLLKEILG